jgi:UDP-N-acetylglucosamine enolpyruvyl transferase
MYASADANSTINVSPPATQIPANSKISGAVLTFQIISVGATVNIKITAYDANKNVLGSKIITVSAAGSISSDVSSLFNSVRRVGPNMRQIVINGKQVSFGMESTTPGVPIQMGKTTSMAVTYNSQVATVTPRPTLSAANTLSFISAVFVCAALLLML